MPPRAPKVLSAAHYLEYSKSSKAACHGAAPCKGTKIDFGDLRYGKKAWSKFGDIVSWYHWGCVTPAILDRLQGIQLEHVPGFSTLRSEDRQKIRTAIKKRQIHPADIPPSARATIDLTADDDAQSSSQGLGKRNADSFTELSCSQPTSSQPPPYSQPSSSQLTFSQATGSQRFAPSASQGDVINIDDDEDVNNSGDNVKDELYCVLKTSIVGVQYYKGLVGSGEEVQLEREFNNKHDKNAVMVTNISGVQIGHLPRNVVTKLVPLLDGRIVTIEAVMHEGNLTGFQYSLSCTLKIFGASDRRSTLEPLLIWATPGQRGFIHTSTATSTSGINAMHTISGAPTTSRGSAYNGPHPSASQYGSTSNAPPGARPTATQTAAQQAAQLARVESLKRAAELKQMLAGLEKVDDEGRRGSLLDTLCAVDDILSLPEHEDPPSASNGELKVNLLRHQSQALKWAIEREYPTLPKQETDKPVQFWLRKNGAKPYYLNIATRTPQEAPPVLGRGALCADSMGLGKTLTMIALILATKLDIPLDFSRSTLIVVPLSVLSNWESQIKEHCQPGAMTYCVYYGANTRSLTAQGLKKYDVVITTYNVVVSEFSGFEKNAGAEPAKKKARTVKGTNLFDVAWKRIILDEGHNIRNPKTKMAKSVCALNAQRRWVLSGTPIINSPKDLGSILTFLRICGPLDKEDFFKRLVLRPLKDGDPSGAELLRAIMTQACIRRTKEMRLKDGSALIPLPPVEIIQVPVTLSDEARALYNEVEELARTRFEGIMARNNGFSMSVQSNALSMLTRLRQLALHPGLIPPNYLQQLRQALVDEENGVKVPITITPEDRARLQGLLARAIEDSEECPVCMGPFTNPRITACAHCFCLTCITEVISHNPRCPMDRGLITMGHLVEPAPPTDLTQAPVRRDEGEEEDDDSTLHAEPSDKINQLVHLLKLTPDTEKSLVFSQFTSFMDKIGDAFEAEGIPYVRFDGTMSAKQRQTVIERFSAPLTGNGITATQSSQTTPQPDIEHSSKRPSRTRKTSRRAVDGDPELDGVDADDSDFNPEDGGYDSFVDDENDAPPKTQKKGKGKASAAKGKGRATFAPLPILEEVEQIGGAVNPKVMLISLKAGALGLNLTVANNVYLMDPWWQEGIESQAIDRCNRIGQKKPVHVYQLIAENTVESKVMEIQERKKLLITEAFSGIKSNETQRQKKEARLHDLIQLFGIRKQALENDEE